MKVPGRIGVAVCGSLLFASAVAAQRPTRRQPGPPMDDTVGVNIALQVGGGSYQFGGRASCTHEPKGYIYGVTAKLWRIQQSEGPRSVMLTFWRPASGSGDMFTLLVSNRGSSYETNTVKGKDAGPTKGSGSVAFTAAGNGGTFTVNTTADTGAKISGTIKCDAFRAATAEAGH